MIQSRIQRKLLRNDFWLLHVMYDSIKNSKRDKLNPSLWTVINYTERGVNIAQR